MPGSAASRQGGEECARRGKRPDARAREAVESRLAPGRAQTRAATGIRHSRRPHPRLGAYPSIPPSAPGRGTAYLSKRTEREQAERAAQRAATRVRARARAHAPSAAPTMPAGGRAPRSFRSAAKGTGWRNARRWRIRRPWHPPGTGGTAQRVRPAVLPKRRQRFRQRADGRADALRAPHRGRTQTARPAKAIARKTSGTLTYCNKR